LLKKEKEVSIKAALKTLGNAPIEDATELLKVPAFAVVKEAVFVTQALPKKADLSNGLFYHP